MRVQTGCEKNTAYWTHYSVSVGAGKLKLRTGVFLKRRHKLAEDFFINC